MTEVVVLSFPSYLPFSLRHAILPPPQKGAAAVVYDMMTMMSVVASLETSTVSQYQTM